MRCCCVSVNLFGCFPAPISLKGINSAVSTNITVILIGIIWYAYCNEMKPFVDLYLSQLSLAEVKCSLVLIGIIICSYFVPFIHFCCEVSTIFKEIGLIMHANLLAIARFR